MGESEIVDELRVIICEEERITAYFTFSSQMCPSIHQFRIYGPKNGLILDQDQETLIKLRGGRFKSYADIFIPPVIFAEQHLGNLIRNVRRSEEHTSELQSRLHLVCRLLLEKKKKKK